ncbi:MAG: MCE family protein [Prevotella sp.]|jgi:phospholipid/cholesterol/gamma-HCH transport system substrate-binding protein|nr:MCE family protein [Prevotella sp.]MBQ8059642.1 MCE family protein [Prevotella sp.]
MNKIFTKEVKIALVAIVALVLLFFGLNFLKGLTLFSSSATYNMSFKDLKGLSESTAIYADGYKVGTVTSIEYDYENAGNVLVKCDIDPQLRIPKGSQAEIESDLMGNIKVNLLLANNPKEKIEPGGLIMGIDEKGMMAQFQEVLPTVMAIVPKLDSIVTSVNTILANPSIVNILRNAEDMTANLKVTTSELNSLAMQLNRSVPGMMQHANATLQNTETLTGNLAKVDVDATMKKIDNTLDNLEQMSKALNNREGTLGLLMYDKGVYNNLNSTMRHADSLMIDLKAHPKRYVHFSVFGKKDKAEEKQ